MDGTNSKLGGGRGTGVGLGFASDMLHAIVPGEYVAAARVYPIPLGIGLKITFKRLLAIIRDFHEFPPFHAAPATLPGSPGPRRQLGTSFSLA